MPVYCEVILPESRFRRQQLRRQQHAFLQRHQHGSQPSIQWAPVSVARLQDDHLVSKSGLVLQHAASLLNGVAIKHAASVYYNVTEEKQQEKSNMQHFLLASDAISRRRAL